MELKRVGRRRPRLRPRARRAQPAAARARARGGRRRRCPARSPEVATDNEVFKPPFLGSRVVKGISLDEIAGYLNETALFRNQWRFRPEKRRDRRRLQGPHPARAARASWPRPRPPALLVPQVVYGYFPANGDGNDLVIWTDETRTAEWVPVLLPPPDGGAVPLHRRLLPAGRVGRGRLRRLPHRHHGRPGVARRTAELFAADRYTEYLHLHGLGVEMAEALAELWHRRIREEWGFADEDGPSLAGLFRQQYRGGRYSWGYPACPDLEDNVKVAELLERRPHRRRGVRGDRLPVPPRADHLGHHLPPPPGQVLRRPLRGSTSVSVRAVSRRGRPGRRGRCRRR